MNRHLALLIAAAGPLVLLSGCGPKKLPTVQKPFPVRGKIVLANGEPLRGGMIAFYPVGEPLEGRFPAFGFPGPDGAFEVTAFKSGDGLAPGLYKVVISPKEEGERRGSNAGLIPKKFQERGSTPIELEVKAEDNNLEPLVLK